MSKEIATMKMALAGAANMSAAAITNPIDVIKVRMQLEGELSSAKGRRFPGFLPTAGIIVQREGILGLYKGLAASLMREGSYSSIRLGLYDPMKEIFGATDPNNTALWQKIAAGACTGAIGSALANPTDLVKIRMQSDIYAGPPPINAEGTVTAPRYSSAIAAFREIARTEGIAALWTGVRATTQRAAILTATQIPSYDHSKHFILNAGWMEEGIALHMACSMFAGFMTATITSPVDVIKTRIMNRAAEVSGTKGLYAGGTLGAAQQIIRTEGIMGMYKGWFANWMRIGPHTIVTLMIFERLRAVAGMRPV